MYDMAGNMMSYEIRLPGGGTADLSASTLGIFSFFWDEGEQLLFIVDGTNRRLYALDLDCGTGTECLGDIADDFGFTVADGGGPDGVVDFGDFVALLGLIGPCDGGVPGCLGDIADDFGFTAADGGGPDGVVDFGDFVALLGLIGPCP